MSRLSLFFLLAVAGCPTPSPVEPADAEPPPLDDDCGIGFLGDPNKPVEFDFRVLRVDGTDVALNEMDDVALIFPPQGGRVVFVGVRATNIDGCGVQLTGAVRDETTKQVRIDARTVNLIPSGDGWGTSAPPSQTISAARDTYSNVPLCPNQWASTHVFGREFQLEVTLKDRAKRTRTKTIRVTPRCNEPDKIDECLCICKLGYILGEDCTKDGGGDT